MYVRVCVCVCVVYVQTRANGCKSILSPALKMLCRTSAFYYTIAIILVPANGPHRSSAFQQSKNVSVETLQHPLIPSKHH